mgnify:CR=1 FL=1
MNASTDSHKSRHKSTPASLKSFVTKQTKNVTIDAGCDHGSLVTFPWRLVTFPGQRCDLWSHGINLRVSGHSAQIRTRKAIFRNSICAHIQNSGRVKPPLFCCFALHIKGEILGYPDFTFIFICASAKSRGAVFLYIFARARARGASSA